MLVVTSEQIGERWDLIPDIIKDAAFSPLTDDSLEGIKSLYHLSDSKYDDLRYLCAIVFLGFLNVENLYKEIKDRLQIDPRLALEIYHELDKKIFESIRKEIEDNYIRFKIGAGRENQVEQAKPVTSQVVLREGPSIINLKPEVPAEAQSTKLKIEGVTTAEKPKESAPVSLGSIQPTANNLESKISVRPAEEKKPEDKTIPEGPFILHKIEGAQSVAGAQSNTPYKQASFGGYFGSMKSAGMQKPQDSISTARVEMPFGPKAKEDGGQKVVPVVVKRYEQEPVKTVHISDFKTPLEKSSDGTIKPVATTQPISIKKPEIGGGMVDLTNLTIRK
jgi:hypothetical protein